MKTALISLLLIGNLASAATEWTTIPQKIEGQTGDACKLTINTLVVVPPPSQEYDNATTAMNEILSKSVRATTQSYLESVSSLPDRCNKSRAGGLSAELTTTLTFKSATWASWSLSEVGYLGGAHGYANVTQIVLSEAGQAITFDQVLGISREAFIQTVKMKLAAQNRYSEGSFEMWAESKTTDPIKTLNYSADNKGISIFFNSYVIASYAEGPSEVSYTWNELKTILKKDSIFSEYLK